MLSKTRYILAVISLAGFFTPLSCIAGWECWGKAEERYGVPAELLFSIASHESGLKANAVGVNTDGSEDLGLMQINDRWLKDARFKEWKITRNDLLTNPCLNLHVGAWILAHNFKRMGYNWRAVGAYNAKTEWKRANYANKIYKRLKGVQSKYQPKNSKESALNG